MKFRKEDIDRLKGTRTRRKMDFRTPTGERSEETLADELVFDEGEAGGEEGMATAQISSQDTILDEDEGKMTTEPIEPVEEAAPGKAARPSKPGGRATRTTTSSRATRLRTTAEAGGKGGGVAMMAMVILTTVLMLYSVMVLYNASDNRTTGMTKWLADAMLNAAGG
jgi:hypothetical protein